MCGRATLTTPSMEELAEALDAHFDPGDAARYRPRYNLAPSDLHWVLRLDEAGRRFIVPAVWGLPSDQGRPAINVRAEAVRRGALASRGHVLALVDGFYEWRKTRPPLPVWYHPPAGGLLLLAAVEAPLEASARAPRAFTILTTRANAEVAAVHPRMPAVIPPEAADAWLGGAGLDLLRPLPDGALAARDLTTRVNAVAHDDPACLTPAPSTGDPQQPRASR